MSQRSCSRRRPRVGLRTSAALAGLLTRLVLAGTQAAPAQAAPDASPSQELTAHWQRVPPPVHPGKAHADSAGKDAEGGVEIALSVADALSPKQRSMIDGGFTTVSQLTLRLPIGADDEDREDELPVFFGVRCSVKLDAWEETYDVARLDDKPRTAVYKAYDGYDELCLRAALGSANLIARMAPNGGLILATLVVKQTSTEEANRIKDWLIQQQSGVMQSLFSHMLGELTLNQTIKVRVRVPPKPARVELAPSSEQTLAPKTKASQKG